ncbi:MAG TPA: site-2 protease family protein [Thermoanaerobaculia bacterium]|nr:site-2 protease family protein [Thermoanaerobaculia bacterium]
MIHLGSIGRTSLDIDLSFFILIAFFVATFYDQRMGIHYALLWAPVLFLSILLHELAHAGAIALFGYGASNVILGGMGGVTINVRRARPWHDMLISFAGPAASFGLWFLSQWLYWRLPVMRNDPMLAAFIPLLASANLWWGIFNLIPVSPLDGGHVVRNFFRMFLSERTAFVIAVWIAIAGGTAVVVFGLRKGFILLSLLVGWYVYVDFQQWQEYRRRGFPEE